MVRQYMTKWSAIHAVTDVPGGTEATLALSTIIRDTEIVSSTIDFVLIAPFTTTAAAPVWAVIRRRGRAT
jgi:hypothetical protein